MRPWRACRSTTVSTGWNCIPHTVRRNAAGPRGPGRRATAHIYMPDGQSLEPTRPVGPPGQPPYRLNVSSYPPLNLLIRTPMLELRGATDELLEALVPIVRAGVVDADAPLPFDDPMSLYEDSPEREWRWLRAIWAGRGRVDPDFWRLYFVVCVEGEPIG